MIFYFTMGFIVIAIVVLLMILLFRNEGPKPRGPRRQNMLLVVICGLAFPGLSQFYNGNNKLGTGLLIIGLIPLPILGLLAILYGTWEGIHTAQRINRKELPKPTENDAVFWLLGLFFLTCQIIGWSALIFTIIMYQARS